MRHVIFIAAFAVAAPALAETTPKSGAHDARVRTATFVDGQVYRIETSLTHVTSIEFGQGETIRSVIAGDTEGFLLDGVPGGRAFAIKPTLRGATTNITVYTDRRSYYFNVVEVPRAPHYVVRFDYPEERDARPDKSVAAALPNYGYGVSDQTEITPVSVYDDGTFTYFQFAPNQPVPAVFRVGLIGMERSVNALATTPGTVRVSGVSKRWVLRLGEQVVCVEALPAGRPAAAPIVEASS